PSRAKIAMHDLPDVELRLREGADEDDEDRHREQNDRDLQRREDLEDSENRASQWVLGRSREAGDRPFRLVDLGPLLAPVNDRCHNCPQLEAQQLRLTFTEDRGKRKIKTQRAPRTQRRRQTGGYLVRGLIPIS